MRLCVLLLLVVCVVHARDSDDSEEDEAEEQPDKDNAYYKFLYKRLKQQAKKRAPVPPAPYRIPGPMEPLPGRSHNGDYWPVFPFANQYSGGVELDPSESRHIGGDINIPVPTWGMMDITGHYFNRTPTTTTKFGYVSQPVNMLGLTKEDFTELMSDPALHHNRNVHPLLPIGQVPRSNVPMSCRPPLCNPYTQMFSFGMEHDYGDKYYRDGYEGDINIPIPVGKDLAYRFPIGGTIFADIDNITVSYGHNLASVDPYQNPLMFNSPGFYKYFEAVDRFHEVDVINRKSRKTRSVLQPELGGPFPPTLPPQYYSNGLDDQLLLRYPQYRLRYFNPATVYQPVVQRSLMPMPPHVEYPPTVYHQPVFQRNRMSIVSQPVPPHVDYLVPYPVPSNVDYQRPPPIPYPYQTPMYSYQPRYTVSRRPPVPRYVMVQRQPPPLLIRILLKEKTASEKNGPSGSTKVSSNDFKHPLRRTKRFYSIFDPSKRLKRMN